jgi:hypothetical protein
LRDAWSLQIFGKVNALKISRIKGKVKIRRKSPARAEFGQVLKIEFVSNNTDYQVV